MRIVLLNSHLEIGGIPVYVVSLARALTRRGHSVFVMSAGGALEADLKSAGIPHLPLALRVKSEFHPNMLRGIVQIVKAVNDLKPDLLHAHSRVTQVAAGLAGRITGTPVVTTCHGFYKWRWGREAFPFWGARVMAVSRVVARRLTMRFHVPKKKVTCIPNGIEWEEIDPTELDRQADRYRQAWGISTEAPVIGSVARLVPAKGHAILIRAFHELRKYFLQAQLIIVGDGPIREDLVRLAYELGDQDHVILTGSVGCTAIPLRTFTVFVQPSLKEAFGLSLVEAMAMHLPVVASSIGGMREIVSPGETGYRFPCKSSSALAEALRKIIENPARAKTMGESGYRRYRELFTMDRVAREVEAVYTQTLKESHS